MNNDIEGIARCHVNRKLGFFTHLTVYMLVNSGLLLLNMLHSPARPWSLAPLLGWGLGLSFHGLAVWLHRPGQRWKQRMIEREIRKIEGQP